MNIAILLTVRPRIYYWNRFSWVIQPRFGTTVQQCALDCFITGNYYYIFFIEGNTLLYIQQKIKFKIFTQQNQYFFKYNLIYEM